MDDVINRKDAIGAILSIEPIAELSDGDAVIRVSAANYVLGNLPSAQPEIIHCKDCKWKNRHNCTRAVEVFIDDDKYCAWAVRRTDE